MTIHRPIRLGIEQALSDIFVAENPVEGVIEKNLRIHKKWGSRDRRTFAESTYDIVRWWRKLVVLSGQEWRDDGGPSYHGVIPALVEHYFSHKHDLAEFAMTSLADQHSYSDYMQELCSKELGAVWQKLAPKMNQLAPVFLRTNTLKTTKEKLRAALVAEDFPAEFVEGLSEGLRLEQRKNILRTKAFLDGWFEIQDGGSQKIAEFLDPQPNMKVIDACAGAGGKTLHIAALMKNRGSILALDIHDGKLNELKKRSKRAGASIIESHKISGKEDIIALHGSAHRVLMDVPCSGLGVLRRHPGTKWSLQNADLQKLWQTQETILTDYSLMVKPKGYFVYSTCSVLPSENESPVKKFLNNNSEFSLVKEEHISPLDSDYDGFYMALVRRNENP